MKEWALKKAALLVFRLADIAATRWHYYSAQLLQMSHLERGRRQARKIIREGRVISVGR